MSNRERNLIGWAKFIYKEWLRNYRYHGGLQVALRALHGYQTVISGNTGADSSDAKVDCVTFSVLPGLTALWSDFMNHALALTSKHIYIGDCSGGLRGFSGQDSFTVLPLLNLHHDKKLDLFVRKVCKAKYILVCDDDVFWLNSVPWEWAIEQFEGDPEIAVVSLIPRPAVSSLLEGKVKQPMGSFCLVLRRAIWLREALSFQVVYPFENRLNNDGTKRYYDTADWANLLLLERGYKVAIAPPEVREHIMSFMGTSVWAMRIQEKEGGIEDSLMRKPFMIRRRKALRAVLVAKELNHLIADEYTKLGNFKVLPPHLIEKTEYLCRELMTDEQSAQIEDEVAMKIRKLRTVVTDNAKILGQKELA